MKYTKTGLRLALLLTSFTITVAIAPIIRSSSKTRAAGPAQQAKPAPPADKSKQAGQSSNPAAQNDQTIKLGAALVTVPFNVTDKHNAYVNDLKKEDIELLEDNKMQTLFSFERQTDLPITIAMLIDISGSESYTLPSETSAGGRFFAKVLRPNKDLGAVVTFESEAVLVQDLTENPERLQDALRRVRPSLVDASTGSVSGTPPIVNSNTGSTALYDAVYSVSSDLLQREAGRRVIILITDGFDTSSSLKVKDAIEAAWKHEIIVYSIGIGDPLAGGVNTQLLKRLASETGGRAFFPRRDNDLDSAFSQIDDDLRQQYIVSYEPTNEAHDGSFRTIQVRVKDKKELTVRYRRGYFAPKG
ncbi:MAG TPA: VWA domain-containing protein [Blastocatellia bacterium]